MLTTDRDGEVRRLVLDRPERRNALTPDGLDALRRAVEASDAPVIAIRGAGSAFCAGADLDTVADLDREGAAAFARKGQRTARAIAEADAIVVAEVDGPARGGGLELALACDLRVATPDATFGEPGVTFGLFGAWGGTVRLPRVLGEGAAMDLALSGRSVGPKEALRMGLVTRIADDPTAVAAEIARNDPAALAAIKRRLRDDRPVEDQEESEAEAFATLIERYEPADR